MFGKVVKIKLKDFDKQLIELNVFEIKRSLDYVTQKAE